MGQEMPHIFVKGNSMESRKYIFYAGDSTAAQKKDCYYPETGIGQMLPLFFNEDVTIHNHAINGRSTKSFIDEGRLERIDKEIREGDYLFIQFGHNDEKSEDPTRYTTPYGTFKDNLKTFINVARKHKATPVLLTAIVRRKFNENGELEDTHGDYITAVLETAKEEGCMVIDMNALTREYVLEKGDEESRKLYMNFEAGIYDNYPDGKTDNTHLRPEGARAYAALMAHSIKEQGGELAELLN